MGQGQHMQQQNQHHPSSQQVLPQPGQPLMPHLQMHQQAPINASRPTPPHQFMQMPPMHSLQHPSIQGHQNAQASVQAQPQGRSPNQQQPHSQSQSPAPPRPAPQYQHQHTFQVQLQPQPT
jgi:hypothetical protein